MTSKTEGKTTKTTWGTQIDTEGQTAARALVSQAEPLAQGLRDTEEGRAIQGSKIRVEQRDSNAQGLIPIDAQSAETSKGKDSKRGSFAESEEGKTLKQDSETFESIGKGVGAVLATLRVGVADYRDDLKRQAEDYESAKESARAFAESIPLVGGALGQLEGALLGLSEAIFGSLSESLKQISAEAKDQQASMMATGAANQGVENAIRSLNEIGRHIQREHDIQGMSPGDRRAAQINDWYKKESAEIGARASAATELNRRASAEARKPLQDQMNELEPQRQIVERKMVEAQKFWGRTPQNAVEMLQPSEKQILTKYHALETQRDTVFENQRKRQEEIDQSAAQTLAIAKNARDLELSNVSDPHAPLGAIAPTPTVAPPNAAVHSLGSPGTLRNLSSKENAVSGSTDAPPTPVLSNIEKLLRSIADTMPAIAEALGKRGPVVP